MPKFSVIIPTRNRFDFLLEAIESVRAQTLRDFELIIVNDGDALPSTLPDDPRIKLLDSGKRGAVPARNLGVAHAAGDMIAWLDDDDQWTDEHHLAAALASHSDFYFADGVMPVPGEKAPRAFAYTADAKSLERDNTILISAVCYRKSLHNALGTFDETLPYYWDWDWYLRVARAGYRLHHRNEIVTSIRIHPQNMSGQSNVKERQANLDLFATKHDIGPLVLKNHLDFTEAR